MKAFLTAFLLLLSTLQLTVQSSQIRIEADGGYTGIVIKISKDVPEEQCPQILANLKVSWKGTTNSCCLVESGQKSWENARMSRKLVLFEKWSKCNCRKFLIILSESDWPIIVTTPCGSQLPRQFTPAGRNEVNQFQEADCTIWGAFLLA